MFNLLRPGGKLRAAKPQLKFPQNALAATVFACNTQPLRYTQRLIRRS